jgi:hypothetical protein
MAEPRENPILGSAPTVDEKTKLAGMRAAAATAATMPQVDPKTGQLPDLFQGKFGFIDILAKDKIYGEEIKAIINALNAGNSTLADTLYYKSKWGMLSDKARENYLLKLRNSNLYQENLKSWLINIKKQLASQGLKADDATLEKYYIDGKDDATILDDLAAQIKVPGPTGTPATTAPTGQVASNLKALQETAKANGLDLFATFGSQVDTWLSEISRGKPVEDFEDVIRSKAAEGKSKFVQEQLKLGKNLRQIYGSYIEAMAGAFNIDPSLIDIGDDLFNKAFTDKGPIKINEFQNLLRKDPRYGQTPSAATETDLRKQIADRALSIGAQVTEADINSIVDKLMATGAGSFGQATIDGELRNFIKYGTGAGVTGAGAGAQLGGQAGNNLQILKETAAANGLDLERDFGLSIQDWLRKIDQGESIETYKRLIRSTAANGLPDNIKKTMEQGVDLSTIYSPYRNIMSAILEINPESITLNDPTLRSAIGPDKEMSLYEYQRALRKDPRWQYTNNAREQVADATLEILRDFGFQG